LRLLCRNLRRQTRLACGFLRHAVSGSVNHRLGFQKMLSMVCMVSRAI
jgi:hypothetical protein